MSTSLTLVNATINKRLLYKMVYFHHWDYPVSNNWLKIYSYNIRRRLKK